MRSGSGRALTALATLALVLTASWATTPTGIEQQLASDDESAWLDCAEGLEGIGEGASEGENECETELHDSFLDSRQIPGDTITSGDLAAAVTQAAAIDDYSGLEHPDWEFTGPTNIGGRITDIAADPTLRGRVFVATAAGGLWVGDGSVSPFTLSQAWPNNLPQAIGAVTVAENGDVWVGTGEVNPGGGSLGYGGDGLYKSTDHGATWSLVGLAGSSTIGAIRFNPNDPNILYVASGGSLFAPGGIRGLYKSTDYGATFTRVLEGLTDFTGASDIAMDPSNPDKLFVPMWDHHREWLCRCYTGIGTGLYLTTDGGATWTRLANNRITAMTPGDNIGFTSTANNTTTAQTRLGVAIAPNNPNRVYVVTGNWNQVTNGAGQTQRGFRGWYRSNDGGATFQTMSNPGAGGDTVWTSKIWVDPNNADRLWVAGVSLRLSSNGGSSWSSVGTVHADHHAMAWDTFTPTTIAYQGNDGGIYRSTNNATSWTKATNEPYTQFYSVDVSEQNPNRIVGGTQDNGCLRSWNGSGVTNPPAGWGSTLSCGDGLDMLIDYNNQNNIYGCSQFGSCSRSTNAGNSTSGFGSTTSARRQWQSPIVLDPNNPAIVYFGGNQLNRNTNFANGAFTVISPSLSNPASGTDPSYPFGTISAVAIAKTNPSHLYVGTDDGWLWGSTNPTNSFANWTRFMDPDLPARWVTQIAVDPTDENVAYVTYSGLRNADNNSHILMTTDAGANWDDITFNLPMAPTQDVIVTADGSTLIVATDMGVYVARPGQPWRRLGGNLPQTPVTDIEYRASTNDIVAATYGRGMWTLSLDSHPIVTLTEPAEAATQAAGDPGNYPLGSTQLASFSCEDLLSALTNCDGTVADGAAFDTSTVGFHSFTVTSTNAAGRTTTVTHQYNVYWPDFDGFRQPIDNGVLNVVKAGQAIPIKFSLGGDMGLAIFAAGFPVSQPVTCDASLPTDIVEETVNAGGSSLNFGNDQYVYVWKTNKSWSGTCRELIVKLADNTEHTALFKFN